MLPPNTDLVINGERVTFESKDEDGHPKLERLPFFWTSIIGIEYYLLDGDKIIKKDRLPSEFRIASIFWPPLCVYLLARRFPLRLLRPDQPDEGVRGKMPDAGGNGERKFASINNAGQVKVQRSTLIASCSSEFSLCD
jgi:hypothetical protein